MSSVGNSMNFQSYSSCIISRTNSSTQDLSLSLHSFQDNSGGYGLLGHTKDTKDQIQMETNVGFDTICKQLQVRAFMLILSMCA